MFIKVSFSMVNKTKFKAKNKTNIFFKKGSKAFVLFLIRVIAKKIQN